MVAARKESIIIHNSEMENYPDTMEDLLAIKSPRYLFQTYSGVYDFETIIKIIDGYQPSKIIAYCNGMHASIIVTIIHALQERKYRLRIHRAIIINSPRIVITTIILRFCLLESSNF